MMVSVMIFSPLKIFILALVALFIWMIKSPNWNHKDNWALAFSWLFMLVLIVVSILLELSFAIFGHGMDSPARIVLSVILVPVIVIAVYKFFNWQQSKKNYIYLPRDYGKEYVILIYGQKEGEFLKPNFGFPRKRKLVYDHSGVRRIKNTNSQFFSPWTEVRSGRFRKYKHKPGCKHRHHYIKGYTNCALIHLNYNKDVDLKLFAERVAKKELSDMLS